MILRSSHHLRGFTLIEVILATAIIAGMAVIASILWRTTIEWHDRNSQLDDSVHLTRITSMLRDQWAERRRLVTQLDGGTTYQIAEDALTFTTALPILFPNWPLVQTEYAVRTVTTSAGGTRYALVYTERRIIDPAGGTSKTTDSNRIPLVKSYALIEGATQLQWQYFGLPCQPDDDQEAGAITQPAETSQSSPRSDRILTPAEAQRRNDRIFRGLAPIAGLDTIAASEDDPDIEDWRPFDPACTFPPQAIRLVGLLPPDLPPGRYLHQNDPFALPTRPS